MKINGLLLSLLAICFFTLFGSSSFAQEAFIKYKFNNKDYNFKSSQVNCFYHDGDKYGDESEVDFVVTTGYVMFTVNAPEKLSFAIRVAKGQKIAVGTYAIQDKNPQTKVLPNVHMSLDRVMKDKTRFYGTTMPSDGVFKITKVTGEWIEGTFEVVLPNMYETDMEPLKLTNGSFRLRAKKYVER